MGTHPIFESDFDCLTDRPRPGSPDMRFTAIRSSVKPVSRVPYEWRPLTVREIVAFPRFPKIFPNNMSFYGVNAEELVTQKVTMENVTSVETVLQPWRPNSSHHKKLWKKLYSQNAQQSNVKTLFKTTVANNSTEDPYTKITFEDGQVLNLKTEKLEYDYMAYIVVRELAERAMIAQSSEETKV